MVYAGRLHLSEYGQLFIQKSWSLGRVVLHISIAKLVLGDLPHILHITSSFQLTSRERTRTLDASFLAVMGRKVSGPHSRNRRELRS